jgi:segregation and condensation protein B
MEDLELQGEFEATDGSVGDEPLRIDMPESEDLGTDPEDARHHILASTEALIFASTEPLTESQLVSALGDSVKGQMAELVRDLNLEYEREGRAFEILHIAGGYSFFTRRDFSGVLRKLFAERSRTRLSRAALETLAVVAFRGPVTRAEIDEIRGVDSGGVLRTLLDRRLVSVKGRANMLGRPLLYETTPEFLKHFGLSELSDLPRDSELLREWGAPQTTSTVPLPLQPEADDHTTGEVIHTNGQEIGLPESPETDENANEKDANP